MEAPGANDLYLQEADMGFAKRELQPACTNSYYVECGDCSSFLVVEYRLFVNLGTRRPWASKSGL